MNERVRRRSIGGRPRLLHAELFESRELLAADLVAHWRAESLVTQLPDGASVSQWADAAKGVTAVASGSPKLIRDGLGGRAIVRLDATDGVDLFRVDRLQSPMSGAADFSIVVLFRTAATNLLGGETDWFKNTALVDANSLGVTYDWGVSVNSAGKVAAGLGLGFGKNPVNLYSPQANLNDGQWHTAILRRAGAQISLQVDEGSVVERNDGHTSVLSSLDLLLGAQKFGTNGFTGDLAEVRVYSGALSAGELSAMRSELQSFYNNRPPVANPDRYVLLEDTLVFAQPASTGVLANDSDPDLDPITALLLSRPRYGTIQLGENGSFAYSPQRDFFGIDSFTYNAADSRYSIPTTVTLEVLPVYDAAVPVADSYKSLPRSPLSVSSSNGVLANDLNVDGVTRRVVLSQNVTQGILQLNPDGSFVFDAKGFVGETSFFYRVDDGTGLSNPVPVTLIVNSPPQVGDDNFTLAEDGRLDLLAAQGILANDRDEDGQQLLVKVVENVQHGKLTIGSDGALAYEPARDFFGIDQFRYQVFDGFDSSFIATAKLLVTPVNDLPIGQGDRYTALPNQQLSIDVAGGLLANDTDVDDSTLQAVLVRGPSHGMVTLRPDGSFLYQPTADFIGSDEFFYQAKDRSTTSEPTRVELIVTATPVIIREFLAANSSSLATRTRRSMELAFAGDTTTPDWIELENQTSQPLDLGGMHLTDDLFVPAKWTFPAGTILPGGGRMIVYASELNVLDPRLDENRRLHTNFSLSRDGEYLALNFLDGTPISEFAPAYPVQRTDVSYGVYQNASQYFTSPTPLAENTAGIKHVVEDTSFSVRRGFYTTPFTVQITTATPGATLVYSLDGSDPSLTKGVRVDALSPDQPPIVELPVSKTSVVRAAAFKDGMLSTNIDTQTYLFVSDIVKQNTLSSTIKNNATWGPLLDDALLALPTVSLVSGARFSEREAATSMELIFADGQKGFQVDAGLEHFGGTSLSSSPKKSMRLSFKSKYGAGSLKHDLFGDGAVDEYEQLLLRTGSHDTWLWTHPDGGRGNFLRNRWGYDRHLEMGQLAPHGRFVHVYINGVYWGMHELMERPEADFMAAYDGGMPQEYDVINAGQAVDGNLDAWRMIMKNEVIDDYERVKQYVNLENYADYMLLQFYGGNDWDWNTEQNWMAARRRAEGAGFVFFSWDSDVMLRTTATANVINRGGPGNLWNVNGGMKQHAELRMMMADRAQKYFFDDGMFTDDRLRADIEEMAARIRLPIIAESARWGGTTYTPTVWESAVKWMLDRFAPLGPGGRAETVIGQLRKAGIYPAFNAPRFAVNGVARKSTLLQEGDQLTLSSIEGQAYYTLDGNDPRLAGGAIRPEAIAYSGGPIPLDRSATIRVRSFKDNTWSALVEEKFQINTIAADPTNLRISEIHYHPADPTTEERMAGARSDDDFEYIELVNLSTKSLDLRDVAFVQKTTANGFEGIEFRFRNSVFEFLPPLGRVVIVKNEAAFRARYGSSTPVAGQWSGALSNSGEWLVLKAGTETIHEFAYSDRWVPETDGKGRSLQAVSESNPDRSTWASSFGWRASASVQGSPGFPDRSAGDANRDGRFDSRDLVLVMIAGKYEEPSGVLANWEEGDWNGDGRFNSADLVLAFMAGEYESVPGRATVEELADVENSVFDLAVADATSAFHSKIPVVPSLTDIGALLSDQLIVTRTTAIDRVFEDSRAFHLDLDAEGNSVSPISR